jgi:NAD+ synthase (glutamine-hydrolysing)
MLTVRIAQAQINTTVGDLKGNSDKIIKFIKEAKRNKADIITFPEMAIAGYPPEDLLFKPQFIKDNLEALKKISRYTDNIVALVGFVDKVGDKIYNACALLAHGQHIYSYHKILLPNYGVFDEKRYFTPGEECLIFKLGDLSFGVNICEDIWEENGPASFEALKGGAQVLLNISASPYSAGKLNLRETILRRMAKRTKAYIFYNNLVGGQDELVFDGASMIVNAQGKILSSAKQFEEELLVFDINPKEKTPLPISQPAKLKPIEEIYQALILGTRDYVKKNNFRKVTLGLSGGIDSALVACIAKDALGAENVIAVTMPSKYTSSGTYADSRKLASNLKIRLLELPIGKVFESYLRALKNIFKNLKANIAEENLQARIRGNLLMALSNKFGYLVLTTGNKSETSTGYCTLYGDMAGGFAVIKDVPKTLVYKLAEYVNRREVFCIIPPSIINRAPSAELKPNQKDQDTLPPYSVLDGIIKAYVEEDKSLTDILKLGFKKALVKKVISMVDRNEYKRRQAPPGVKITPRAFGRDRRMPITNQYKI